jgi:hypothetical protein
MIILGRMPLRTVGLARQGLWLGQVGIRLGAGPSGPVAAPQATTVYPGYQFPPAEPGESQDVQTLALNGARLDVEISVPASVIEYYTSRGQAPPQKQMARALIDTGASISGLKPSLAQAAGLIQTSSVGISGVVGTQTRPVYIAAIHLPEYNINFDTMDVAGVDLPQQDVDVLLGRDILRHLVFTFQGKFGTFTLQDGEDRMSELAAGGIFAGTIAAALLL